MIITRRNPRNMASSLVRSSISEIQLIPTAAAPFMKGAAAVGINWISDIEELTREDAMFRGLRLVMIMDDWFADFLRRILESYDHRNPMTPDEVADSLESYLLDFQH